ncbi:MAG TPA: hypothetical protein VFM52_08045 [Rhodanobacter sp.]|nr:hypothetical protein [Rhodanobacter sp.]
MDTTTTSGLGELLRCASELVDQGADEQYRARGLGCRARYTPVLRAIAALAAGIGYPLRGALEAAAAALERRGCAARLHAAAPPEAADES